MSARIDGQNQSLDLFSRNFERMPVVTQKQLKLQIKIEGLNNTIRLIADVILSRINTLQLNENELLRIKQAIHFTKKYIAEVCKASVRLNMTSTNRKIIKFLKQILKPLHQISSGNSPLKDLYNLQTGIWNRFLDYSRIVIQSDQRYRKCLFEKIAFSLYADVRTTSGVLRVALIFMDDFLKRPLDVQSKFMQTKTFNDTVQLLYHTKDYLAHWGKSKRIILFPDPVCYRMALLHYELEEIINKLNKIELKKQLI